MQSVEAVIDSLHLSSGEFPRQCILNAVDPIHFIDEILDKDGANGVIYSNELKNDLYLIKNALIKEQQQDQENKAKAVWKLWEQLKIDGKKAKEIISRCDQNGFAFASPFHILVKEETGAFRLYKKERFPAQYYF